MKRNRFVNELLDQPRLIAQLCALERRTSRAGKDSIDHPPGGHDDIINAVAGALTRGLSARGWRMVPEAEEDVLAPVGPLTQQLRLGLPFALDREPLGTCGECVSLIEQPDGHRCRARRFFVQPREVACDWFHLRAG